MAKKIAVKKIEITRGEGPSVECGITHICMSWEAADSILYDMSKTAPRTGGYDKTDFVITFKDGEEYSGRYDLKHHSIEDVSLSGHVVDFVRFHGGLLTKEQLPSHVKSEDYSCHVDAEFAVFYEAYDLGPMQKIEAEVAPRPAQPGMEIRVGTPVYTGLYCRGYGVVVAVHGKQNPASMRSIMGGAGRVGGSAHFDIVFEDGSASQRLPEAILWGVQWKVFTTIKSKAYIAGLVKYHKATVRKAELAEKKAIAKREADRIVVAKKYYYLTRCNNYDRNAVAKNIRIELKREFPGVKFSVRGERSCIYVSWTDGPSRDKVEGLVGKYKTASYNANEDYHSNVSSAFNDLFGGVDYVDLNRENSHVAIKKAINKVWKDMSDNLKDSTKPAPEEYEAGRLYTFEIPGLGGSLHHNNLQAYIGKALAESSHKAA
jgi:hypothetical protein